MSVLIEAFSLRKDNTGVGYYAASLIRTYARLFPEIPFVIAYDSDCLSFSSLLPSLPPSWRLLPFTAEGIQQYGLFQLTLNLRRIVAQYHVRTLHGLSTYLPLTSISPSLKTIVTLHDCFAYAVPQWIDFRTRLYYTLFGIPSLKKADHIIAVSNTTKHDAIRFHGLPEEKISVIYEDAAIPISPSSRGERLPYILFVGALRPIKGVETLLEAYAALGPTPYRLILAGDGALSSSPQAIDALLKRFHLTPEQVEIKGRQTESDLQALYQQASLFVLPSYYEGFGLPLLEAMRSGTPVIARKVGSMPEIGGDAALYFSTAEELQQAIKQVLTSTQKAESMSEMGLKRSLLFSWETAARRTAALYRI